MSNITKISVGGTAYDIKDASVASAISSAVASEATSRESADTELGSRIDAKADSADVYTKTQVDTSLSAKADASTTYTKTEVDTALSGKANSSHTHTKSQITDLVVPTKTSELTNDAGFAKFVVSETAPAEGTPNDVVTAILGNIGGGGEGGAWELIGEGTNIAVGNTFTLSKSIDQFDFVVLQSYVNYSDGYRYFVDGVHCTSGLLYDGKECIESSDDYNNMTFIVSSKTSIYTKVVRAFNCFKLYGISLRGKSNVYSTDEVAIGKWIDGKTIYRKVVTTTSYAGSNIWRNFYTDNSIDKLIDCRFFSSTSTGYTAIGHFYARKNGNDLQAYAVDYGWNAGDTVILEYTKNEG